MKTKAISVSRRLFLVRGAQACAGLSLGLQFSSGAHAASKADPSKGLEANAFVSIHPDNRVILTIKHLEMGQGTYTGLATLMAEELDADWAQIETVAAPANPEKFKNLLFGGQLTGGSSAIANSYSQMREAGAVARHMLVAAAAAQWQVKPASISVKQGIISHAVSKRSASFGDMAIAAAQQKLPSTVILKDPKDFVLIGKANLARKDTGKTNGKAIFTQDVQLPNMLTAVVAHPPAFGASLKSVDASTAEKLPGVKAVVTIPSGVAVLADTFWQAKKGRDALNVEWNKPTTEISSPAQMAEYKKLAQTPGLQARNDGNVAAVLGADKNHLIAEYEFPYLAHAAMEPMNCVLQKTATGVEMWYGCQGQSWDQAAVAKVFGLAPEHIKINTLLAGGSFGRRATFNSDYAVELANIVKAWGKSAPVKLVWTREDDTQGGYYRPAYVHRLAASLNSKGDIAAWQQCIVGQAITGADAKTVDRLSVEGAANLPYAIPNILVEAHNTYNAVPVSFWRSVGSTHTAYAVETFIDELAHRAKQDPLNYRLAMLKDHPRHRGVLKLVAERAGWGKKLPAGHFQGLAVHESFNSYVAQVAEIAKLDNGKFRIHKITCAVDCGVAVNPDVIRAQMEGGIGFGLSPLMLSEITLDKSQAQQKNFDAYKVIRIQHMPEIEVHIVPSAEAPTGVGEPGTPVVAPAVANALFAATGKRLRKLPAGAEFFQF